MNIGSVRCFIMSDINDRYGYCAEIELEFQLKQRMQEQSKEIENIKLIFEELEK